MSRSNRHRGARHRARWHCAFASSPFLVVCLAACLVTSGPRRALAEAAPEGEVLNLSVQDAVKTALSQNPNIQSDQEKLKEIAQTVNFSIAQVLPTLAGTGSSTRTKAPILGTGTAFGGLAYNTYLAQLKLTQPLWDGGAFLNAYDANRKETEVRQRTLEIDSRDLTVQVMEAYYTTLTNQQVLNILNDTRKVEEATVKTTTDYYRIGRAQLLDVLQAKTTLALLIPQISNAENQMKSAASQLMQLLHESQSKSINLAGPIAFVDPERVQTFLDKKHKLPEITRGEDQITEFHDQANVQLAVYNPTASVSASAGQESYTTATFFSDYGNTWSVSLNINIPIFNGLASIYEKRVLASQEAELEYGQVSLLDQLSYNQIQAERNLQVAATVLKSSREADNLSKASLKEAQRDFRLQTINYLQLLTSQQNYLSAESSYVQSQYSYIDAVAKYFVATGIPIGNLIAILNR